MLRCRNYISSVDASNLGLKSKWSGLLCSLGAKMYSGISAEMTENTHYALLLLKHVFWNLILSAHGFIVIQQYKT